MPKPMTLIVQVEEFAHGRVFRMLDGTPGVVSIQPVGEGVKQKPGAAGQNGQKRGGAKTVPCLVLGALLQTPGITREQLRPVLEGNGKQLSSLPDALSKLKKAKHITVKGKGTRTASYNITTAGRKYYDTACTVQPSRE